MSSAAIRIGLAGALLAASPAAVAAGDPRIDGMVHREIAKCWSLPPSDTPYVVTVRFELGRDGSLASGPAVVAATPSNTPDIAVQAALRAVRRCTPIALPAESYEYWRQVEIKFAAEVKRPFGSTVSP